MATEMRHAFGGKGPERRLAQLYDFHPPISALKVLFSGACGICWMLTGLDPDGDLRQTPRTACGRSSWVVLSSVQESATWGCEARTLLSDILEEPARQAKVNHHWLDISSAN